MEAGPGFEPGCADMHSAASPLRHPAFVIAMQYLAINPAADTSRIGDFLWAGAGSGPRTGPDDREQPDL